MASKIHSITLVPVKGASQSDSAYLKHSHTLVKNGVHSSELVLGRSDSTGIDDKRCSREHLKLKFDEVSEEIVFSQSGSNPSCIEYGDNEIVLAKHDVKRLPVAHCYSSNAQIYLIHKDRMYQYHICAEKSIEKPSEKLTTKTETKSSVATNSSKSTTNTEERRKRKAGTLDDFLTKKAKAEPATENSDLNGEWTEPDPKVYVFNPKGLKPSTKVAGFDMDSTLIVPKSGAKWPKGKDDWKFMLPNIPKKLKELHIEGYKIVIFTNQGGVATGTVKASDIQYKIEMVIKAVGVPIQAMIAACKKGVYRKPSPGMWDHLTLRDNEGISVDLSDSLYVGDAAGRVVGWQPGKKKDFACSDRLFALNIGVKFFTPEAFFNGEKEGKYEMPEFNPKDALKAKVLLEPSSSILNSGSQELILMVGYPGSGKSYFSSEHLSSYERVNRDTLGNWQKCVARCEQDLKLGKSVVIDNTNPDKESRARYIQVAKKLKVPVRCFMMSTTYKQSRHNEVYRQLTNSKHKPINDMVVNSYKSKYTEPEISEGFAEIVKVNVVLKFDQEDKKALYSRYLLEK